MLEKIKQAFTYKDLRKKILYTVVLLVIFRIAACIPVPDVNLQALKEFFARSKMLGLLDIFSGGAMSRLSIVMMGLAPYINAVIIMELLTMVIPRLEALSREGEEGHNKINRYTRYLTVPLAALESFGMIKLLQTQGQQTGEQILGQISLFQWAAIIITITCGSIFLMWLGELISENGIGNGISLIIFVGIVSSGPQAVGQTFASLMNKEQILEVFIFLFIALAVVLGVVMVDQGQRKIPVQYAKRIRGMRMYGGVSTHIPLKVNQGGVIPIIFAISLMLFPGMVASFFTVAKSVWVAKAASFVENLFKNPIFYGSLYFLLVVGFTYFYTAIVFNPERIAENLQKQGGFIPGIRPGPQTVEYLHKLLNRINLAGGIFLGAIAVLPLCFQGITPGLDLTIGGTGLLIVVSVILETRNQIKAQLVMRSYEGY
jgi:preprotein translocase subunit SecY